MTKDTYAAISRYAQQSMGDSAHDWEHVRRVLYAAVDIASTEPEADRDILIAACLLHDIGRPEQFADPTLCHAQVGGEKALRFLLDLGWDRGRAAWVRDCVAAHRFRSRQKPETIEAKILFDADKLDVTGAIGVARTLLYGGSMAEPLYSLEEDGSPSDGSKDRQPSFFREYRFKLEGLYAGFYTRRGQQLAEQRQNAAAAFYRSLLEEVQGIYDPGRTLLEQALF